MGVGVGCKPHAQACTSTRITSGIPKCPPPPPPPPRELDLSTGDGWGEVRLRRACMAGKRSLGYNRVGATRDTTVWKGNVSLFTWRIVSSTPLLLRHAFRGR